MTLALLCAPSWAQTAKPRPSTVKKPTAAAKKSDAEEPRISREVYEAEAALDKNDFATAEKLLKRAVADDAKDFRAWLDLGLVYKATDRDAEAAEAFRKAVTLNSKSYEANLNAGLALGATDPAAATDYLRTATTLKKGDKQSLGMAWAALAGVLSRTDPAAAVAAYREWIAVQPESPMAHASLARTVEATDPAQAEQHYKRALELNPKLEHALGSLTNLYLSSKRYADAEGVLRKMTAAEPGNVKARVNLARVLEAQGKNEEASSEYAAILKAEPNNAEALSAAARSAYDARDYVAAEQRFRQIASANPHDALAVYGLSRSLMAQKRYPEAGAALQQVLRIDASNVEAYSDLAFVASATQNYPLALQVLDARTKLAAETPETYFLRATAYDHMRSPKQAMEFYRKFLEASAGRYPDQEWQARGRLNALDPDKKK